MADPKIKIRRSATPNKVPTKDQLQLGELAINTYDGKLYLEQDQGGAGVGNTVIAVNPWNVGVGSTAYNTHFTAGKVGVGTTNAQYNLDVGGNVNFTGNLYQDGSLFTSGSTGVGIKTAGGVVGYAATIIDFRGPGVTTAHYSSVTGIATVNFHSVTTGGGGGGGNASVTVSDSAPGSPSNGDLWFKSDVGELYLYYTDGSSNQWVEASGGSNTVITSDTAPTSPQDGDLWWNSNTGELKVYYNDGNSSQWVDANSEGGFVQYWTQTNTNGNLGVTTTGFVGIGTTTATDALTVVGAADIDGNLIVSGVSTFSSEINLPDNIKASFGTGDDGSIKHTGSNLQIQETTGNIQITNYANDKDVVINSDDGSGGTANYFLADGSTGEALLYHYGNEKIKTTSTGASVTGDLAASGNVTGVAATFTGNVTVEGVLTYEDVKNVDAIGIVTARKGLKVLAGGANIVDGTTTDELNVTGVATAVQLNATTLNVSGVSTFSGLINAADDIKTDAIRRYTDSSTTTKILLNDEALKLHAGHASQEVVKVELDQVSLNNGANLNVSGVTTSTGGVKVGTAATICSEGNMTIDRPSAGIITATKFIGDGSDLTGVISGIGIGTEGGVVGYAATIVHFRGAGVTTAYYSSATGVGTVFFHSTAGGGGGNTNVTIQDAPPSSPSTGDLWWESDTGELKIYYNDGNSSQWVDTSGTDDAVFVSTTAPSNPAAADLWFNSETGDLMIYYTDANTSQWVSVNATNSERIWNTNSTGIHTSRSVGIGTTTVTDALTVVGATDLDGRLIVSGITTFGSHVYHGDGDRAIFGDGSDLEIYHSGTKSIINDAGTGNLELQVGGSTKFATTSSGIEVTGDIVGSGSTAYSTGLIVGKQGAEFQGVVTATTFVGALTGNASGNAATATALQNARTIGGVSFDGTANINLPGVNAAGNQNTTGTAALAEGLTGTPNITVGALTANTGQFSGNVNVLGTLTYEDVKNVDSAGIATARQGLRITGGGLDVVGVSTFNDNVKLLDSDRLQIGTGGDLWLEHNGSNSKINNTTGTFYIQGDTISLAGNNGSHNLAVFTKTGSVDLYFNNAKKFETTSTGVSVTGGVSISGSSTFTGNVFDFADSKQLRFGTGNDFEVFFNGTDQYLKSKAGKIRLQVNDGENSIICNPNAAVELYYDDAKILETAVNRIIVTGNASESNIQFYTSDGNRRGALGFTNSNEVTLYSGTSTKALQYGSNSLKLYYNDSKKFETTSSGISVSGNVNIPDSSHLYLGASNDLDLYHTAGADSFLVTSSGQMYQRYANNLYIQLTGSNENAIVANANGAVELYWDSTKKFETYQYGVKSPGHIVASSDGYGFYAGAGFDIEMLHDGSNSRIKNVTGNLEFQEHTSGDIIFKTTTSGTERLRIKSGGEVAAAGQVTVGGNVAIENDTGKFTVGAGSDLQLFHDGGSSIIRNTNNNASLYIQASSTGTNSIRCYPNGSTQLFHNGNLQVYTDSSGLRANDSVKLSLGSSSDFNFWHDGSHSHIQHMNTGNLYVLCQSGQINFETASETMCQMIPNGAVKLYHNNSVRFETTSTGTIITGTSDGILNMTTSSSNGSFIRFQQAGSTKAWVGSATGLMSGGATNDLGLRAVGDIRFAPNDGTLRCTIDTSGNFYPATTNASNLGSGSLRWGRVYHTQSCINTSSTGSQLTINGASSANVVSIRNTTGGNGNVGILFSTQDHSGGREKAAIYHQETHGQAHYGGDFIFCLANSTGSAGQVGTSDERFRIKRNGYVDMVGASDVRFTLGSTGTAGTNDSNWVRGSGSDIMFNAASGNSVWEAGGAETMLLSSNGDLFLRKSGGSRYVVLGSSGDSGTSVNNNMNWIRGNATNTQYNTCGGFHAWEVSGAQKFKVSSNGDVGAPSGNNIYNASDERLKENIVELVDGLNKVNKLKPVSFTWKDGWSEDLEGVTQYGFGAQTTEAVDELLVEPFGTEDIELDGETIDNPLRVNEKFIIPLLVKAVQELSAEVAALKSSINN